VFKAGDIARKTQVTVIERHDDGLRAGLSRLHEHDREFGYVVDKGQHFHGVVSVDSLQQELRKPEPRLSHAFLADVPALSADTAVSDLLGTVAGSPCGVPVIDEQNQYVGVITKACLLETLDRES
jgi:glycine betaine/proline transport system ATP-binding protein